MPLPQGEVLVKHGAGLVEGPLQEEEGQEARVEVEGGEPVDLVVVLCRLEVVADDPVRVPPGGRPDRLVARVPDGVAPPGRVQEDVPGLQLRHVVGQVPHGRAPLRVELVGVELGVGCRRVAPHPDRVREVEVVRVDKVPLLGAVDHVEEVPRPCVVEGGASALGSHEDLPVAALLLEVRLHPGGLLAQGVAQFRMLVDEDFAVVDVGERIPHILHLPVVRGLVVVSQDEHIVLSVLLDKVVKGVLLSQRGVLDEAAEDHRVRALDVGVVELLWITVPPVVLWDPDLPALVPVEPALLHDATDPVLKFRTVLFPNSFSNCSCQLLTMSLA